MLTIWTDADAGETYNATAKVLGSHKGLQHKTIPVGGSPLVPVAGEVILGMGVPALQAFKDLGIIPKSRTLTWARGRAFPGPHGGHWMFSYNPFTIKMEPGRSWQIEWDLRLAIRLHETGSLEPPVGEYGYTDTLRYVRAYVEQEFEKTGEPVPVATDLETMGLYPWYPDKDIVSISFTACPGYSDVVYLKDLMTGAAKARFLDDVRWLLTSPKVKTVGANLKFDLLWMRVKWGLTCTNFVFDTLLAGSLVDENRSNSLNTHAKVYTDMGGYDDAFNVKHDKGHMEKVPKEDLLPYAGGDTDACLRVYHQVKRQLLEDGALAKFYTTVLHPAARAFEAVEARGLNVDVGRYEKLREDLTTEIEEFEAEALGMLSAKLKNKYADDLTLSRSAIIKDFLFTDRGLNLQPIMRTAKTKEPSTAHDHLMLFEDHPEAGPFIKALEQWSKASKTRSTYVDGFLVHRRPDGLLHPTYNLFAGSMYEGKGGKDDDAGTVTGRTSAKNPAIQTLPKHTNWAKRLRECFIAPPGFVMFQCDFSQGELRIVACEAPESTMLDAYLRGMDLHALTASQAVGMEYGEFMALGDDHPLFIKFRQVAKSANFGLLYGMGPPGYREYARVSYGVTLSEEEAFHQHESFFKFYGDLAGWHNRAKSVARNNLHIRSPLGRVRHLPLIRSPDWSVKGHAERQAINSPIQSCLSDMCLWAIAILEEKFGGTGLLQIAGMTHDSIYGYVPESRAEEMVAHVARVMSSLPLQDLGWEPALDFPADMELGPDMAHLKKLIV